MAEDGMTPRTGRYDSLKDVAFSASTMEPKQDLDRRSINDYISSLSHGQARLCESLDLLEERLNDVLGPPQPQKPAEGETSATDLSPLAHWLDSMVYRQEQLVVRLAGLIERIEL